MHITDIAPKGLWDRAIKEGKIRVSSHPSKKLYIYNYTQKMQNSGKWNDALLVSRGLIVDSEIWTINIDWKGRSCPLDEITGHEDSRSFTS